MKHGPWKAHDPPPQARERKPDIEDDPRLHRHPAGDHHQGQRRRSKKRQRRKSRPA